MKQKYNVWLFMLSIFFIQICFFMDSLHMNQKPSTIPFIIAILLLFAFSQLYLLITQTLEDVKTQVELSALEQQNKLKTQYAKELSDHQEKTRQQQQELSRKLQPFQELLSQEKYEDAKQYLQEITQQFQAERFHPYCHDNLLNAILEAKRSTAQKHHIKVNYEILLTEKCTIPPADVSSVFFNLMDNGIEGCICSENPDPFLSFSAYTDKNYLVIKMQNSKNPKQEFSHTTTKEDFSSHGLGLSIIEEICQRYDGVYEWKDQGDEFVSAVLLRLDCYE